MSNQKMNIDNKVEAEALEGRLPVLSSERIYKSYSSMLWTCCTFSAATWAFLIGSYLPYVGDWRIGVIGYAIGLLIGMALVTLASGVPSHKYGTDVIDSAKSSFGYRGIIIPLFGLLATLIGWSYVVEALTARGTANIVSTINGSEISETMVVSLGILVLLFVWVVTSKGPKLFEKINNYVGPAMMIITVIMFWILFDTYGLGYLWSTQLPKEDMITNDPVRGLALAVEFGMANALTWWPVMGGLTRLVEKRKHVIGPSVMGVGVLGAAFIAAVAALSSISAGTYDPTIWMIELGGPILGSVCLGIVMISNLATMVVMFYLAGVSIQQIKIFSRMRWGILMGVIILPGIYFAFNTEWLLSSVMSWLSYNGVMFVGITGITLVDYFMLRNQEIEPASLFATKGSRYEFWSGVNWVAVAIVGLSTAGYLWLYNPITAESAYLFKYFGASLPIILISGLVYYIAARLVLVKLKKGSYNLAGVSLRSAVLDSDSPGKTVKVAL